MSYPAIPYNSLQPSSTANFEMSVTQARDPRLAEDGLEVDTHTYSGLEVYRSVAPGVELEVYQPPDYYSTSKILPPAELDTATNTKRPWWKRKLFLGIIAAAVVAVIVAVAVGVTVSANKERDTKDAG
jgi:hypothetical protein